MLKSLKISLIFIFLFSACSIENKEILSEVGEYKVSIKDFKGRYSRYLFATGIKDNILSRQAILSNMIDEILLQNYDDNTQIFQDEEYKKNLVWLKKQSILSLLKDREVYANISVTDEEMRTAFARVNEKIAASHLYAETEAEAQSLYELLQSGVSFKTLAAQVFTD